MKFTPKHKTMNQIALEAGFTSVNNGWAIFPTHKEGKGGGHCQYHVAPSSLGYDLHADYLVDGKHQVKRDKFKDQKFYDIFEALDNGEIPVVTKKMLKRYKTMPREWKIKTDE